MWTVLLNKLPSSSMPYLGFQQFLLCNEGTFLLWNFASFLHVTVLMRKSWNLVTWFVTLKWGCERRCSPGECPWRCAGGPRGLPGAGRRSVRPPCLWSCSSWEIWSLRSDQLSLSLWPLTCPNTDTVTCLGRSGTCSDSPGGAACLQETTVSVPTYSLCHR